MVESNPICVVKDACSTQRFGKSIRIVEVERMGLYGAFEVIWPMRGIGECAYAMTGIEKSFRDVFSGIPECPGDYVKLICD